MDVKISGFACVLLGKQSKHRLQREASESQQAQVQQGFFVLGQINTGSLTMDSKLYRVNSAYVCQLHFKADVGWSGLGQTHRGQTVSTCASPMA